MDIEKELGITLLRLRKAKGISQEQMARRTGMSRHYISNIENGERHCSVIIVDKMAKAIGVTIAEVFLEMECGSH